MNPKPIVVIRIPDRYFGGYGDRHGRLRLQDSLNEGRSDYYWFVLGQYDPEQDVLFEVFYEKDHQPIAFEELKKLIEDSLKPNATH